MLTSPARTVYEAAESSRLALPQKARDARVIADNAWEDLNDSAKEAGITLPGDDRAEEIVTRIFAHVAEAAGLDLPALASVIEEVG